MKAVVTLVLAALAASSVCAQQYPVRPIRLVMPFPPGGNVDTLGRVFAKNLEAQLGQPIVIDNRGGANGILGIDIVAKALPDGYTLMDNSFSFVINPSIYRKLPYDTEHTFTAAAVGAQHFKSGKLKALGFSGASRLAALPEVPTIAEAGLPDFLYDSGWHGLFAPARTAPAIVDRLHAETAKAVQEPKLRELLLAGGYEPKADPPAQFAKIFKADIRKYGEIVKAARIEPQ